MCDGPSGQTAVSFASPADALDRNLNIIKPSLIDVIDIAFKNSAISRLIDEANP
jgi:hypothetical protein